MNISIPVPLLKVDPACKEPLLRKGVITVPPAMEIAARTVLNDMAYGNLPKYAIVKRIKGRFAIAHKSGNS